MPALIFDLDGTLVDTVYAHVFSWQRALAEIGMVIDGWRIHRRIGMSGGLFTRAVAREIGREITGAEADALQRRHGELFQEFLPDRPVLPGAVDLLRFLREAGMSHGIATSGRRPEIDASLEALGVGDETVVVAWVCRILTGNTSTGAVTHEENLYDGDVLRPALAQARMVTAQQPGQGDCGSRLSRS